MSRRLVLVDKEETPGFAAYYGCGLGKEVYTVQELEAMDVSTRNGIIATLKAGDAVMSVGGSPFKYLRRYYHFGIRNETFSDCASLYRLSMEGGAFLKEVIEFPGNDVISEFMSKRFSEPVVFPEFKQVLISDLDQALEFIDFLDSLPANQHYGFDYETSGMPLDKEFWVSGFSIVTEEIGAFISFTDLRRTLGGEDNPGFERLKSRVGQFLLKRMDHIWTYNVQFEWQVSHRVFGVDLYNLCDASVVNVMDGFHLKKYSLKWTAQRVLNATVWDTEFDRISDIIDQMYFTIEGKLKKDRKKVIKVTPQDFINTPEWKELGARYPDDIDEMKSLVLDYWGYAFMVPSSRILGYYCCLDSFYTLLIAKSRFSVYSKDCWNVNLDNVRLGARLMGSGLYIDEPFRLKYENYCKDQQVWAITYCAMARCWIKMDKHSSEMADINKLSDVSQKLISGNRFYNGDALEITKDILSRNIDTLGFYDTGLNEGQILIEFGQPFADNFIKIVKDAMVEVKMKTKIDDGIVRKRKILSIIANKITPLLGKFRAGSKKLVELEKYMYYKRAYEELDKVSRKQLLDIDNVPTEIYFFGEKMDRETYYNFVSDNYFKCKSPDENNEIALDFTNLFRAQTAYVTAMFESTQQLPETDKFYSSRGITDIHSGYLEFMDEWKRFELNGARSNLYPDKVFNLARLYYQNPGEERNKETWTNFDGFNGQSIYFPEMKNQYKEYEEHFKPEDLSDDFYFMRKLTLNYLVFKKYGKMLSTYINGMFHESGKWVIEDDLHIPIREADPKEPGAVWKVFCKYSVMEKSSKRWSSPFHTIISHGDCKDCMICPPVWDDNGNIVWGGSDTILSYFDISSAEVKAAGYASLDPDLIAKFEAGEDIYIYSAKLYLGEDGWDKLDKRAKKMWRKRFKTVFLGVLYGLGKNSLAARLESSLDEADHIIQSLYKSFPKLREYVDKQGEYPLQNNGYIKTMLGDKLRLREFYDYLPKATSDRERNNIIARIKRLGVNLPIQGGTSSIMACGFFNNIRESIKNEWKSPLQPIIVVHDSNTNYVPVEKIFELRGYYDKYYTEFCHGIGPGIYLLFDLMVGYSYEEANELKQLSPDTIEFKGTAKSVLKLYDKIMNCKDLVVTCDTPRSQIVSSIKLVEDSYSRFIIENGCNMSKDLSSITVRFKKG